MQGEIGWRCAWQCGLGTALLALEPWRRYLGGVLDFTGELNRYATKRATSRDVAAVQRACTLCEAIMGEMVQFSLRNSSLRKKLDVCNYTLKKLEVRGQLGGATCFARGPAAATLACGALAAACVSIVQCLCRAHSDAALLLHDRTLCTSCRGRRGLV